MQKQTKPEPLGASMAKLVLVIAIIVSLGIVAGVAGYYLTMPKETNLFKMPVGISLKTCKVNSDCFEYNPCGMGISCFNKSGYEKALENKNDMQCPTVEIMPWQAYRYSKEECSCLEGFCANTFSKEKYCEALKESLKWCTGDKLLEYGLSSKEKDNECEKINNLFNENCINEDNTTDETADWKTYRNKEYGFEFKYPKDFNLDEPAIAGTSNDMDSTFSMDLQSYVVENNSHDWDSVFFVIETHDKPASLVFTGFAFEKEVLNVEKGNGIDVALEKAYTGKKGIVTYKDKETDGREEVGRIVEGSIYYTILLSPEKNDYDYSVQIILPFFDRGDSVDIQDRKFIDTFNQILSTFKFTEKNKSE